MKRASSVEWFIRAAAASGMSSIEQLDRMPFQQASATSTPTLTPSGTISPTLTITTTPSTSPSLTLTPATTTPSATISPTISPTLAQTIQTTQFPTSSATATFGAFPTLETTLITSPTVSAIATTSITGTVQVETPLITQTATLIPYPTVSLLIPTQTRTPSLLFLNGKEGSSNLEKGSSPLLKRLRPFLPLLIVLVLWGFLIAWFVVIQALDRR